MARSFRKTPVRGMTTAESEKPDKKKAHQRLRTHFRTQMKSARNVQDLEFDERNFAHSKLYCFAKDGKQWIGLQVRRVGRAMRVLSKPEWMRNDREARHTLNK